ncbi:MAG TPA: hypothetical protein VLD84_00740 [Nitrososphaeraceae archaeon]|nr:hypothetical protein [Nitrososphaeraceae archaeon]
MILLFEFRVSSSSSPSLILSLISLYLDVLAAYDKYAKDVGVIVPAEIAKIYENKALASD